MAEHPLEDYKEWHERAMNYFVLTYGMNEHPEEEVYENMDSFVSYHIDAMEEMLFEPEAETPEEFVDSMIGQVVDNARADMNWKMNVREMFGQ
jgi:hypothetical protein